LSIRSLFSIISPFFFVYFFFVPPSPLHALPVERGIYGSGSYPTPVQP
jgi:hypothetical protein